MTVTVTILDSNDNTPVFTDYSVAILENATIGDPVVTVKAEYADSATDGNNDIKYMIDPPSKQFAIGETSGEITVADVLDRETTDRYDEKGDNWFVHT